METKTRTVMAAVGKSLLLLLPTGMTLYLLLRYFPSTGLGRILALPEIVLVNALVVVFGTILIGRYAAKRKGRALIGYAFVLLLTLLLALALYPQEIGPHVMIQIWDRIVR